MNKNELVYKVINLPFEFEKGEKSIYSLLNETGYFQNYNVISIDLISEALNKNPEYIKKWIQYSEDKRTSSGWYIKEEGRNIVGYFTSEGGFNQTETEYPSITEACAVYIKREIESIRT